jgi:uncharacterized integral membrane protein
MLGRIVTLFLVIAALILAFTFASFNTELIEVNLLFGVYELPTSLVIIGAVVLGAVVGLLGALLFAVRGARERRRLSKALRSAEAEISSLRSLPLNDAD